MARLSSNGHEIVRLTKVNSEHGWTNRTRYSIRSNGAVLINMDWHDGSRWSGGRWTHARKVARFIKLHGIEGLVSQFETVGGFVAERYRTGGRT